MGTGQQQNGGNPAILIVDGDPEMRSYLRRCLRPLTTRVREAAGAEDALALARTGDPESIDLIIVDVPTDDSDGLRLRESLVAQPALSEVPVLIVSADDLPPAAGPFLRKPFQARELRAWVRAMLRSRPP